MAVKNKWINMEKNTIVHKYSIIVPVYNCETYIPKLLDSILNQTFDDFEVVLVDDGSTDSSGSICDRYAQKDPRIIVIHKPNGGVSSARNAGINSSRAMYIVFVDSDDYLDSTFLSDFGDSDTDLIISGYVLENSKLEVLLLKEYEQSSYLIRDNLQTVEKHFINGYYNYAWAKRFKREIIVNNKLEFDRGLSVGEDTLFVLEYICHASNVKVISSQSYHYIKYEHQTLTNQIYSENLIHKIEKTNDVICGKLEELYGVEATRITAKRMSALYRNILNDITVQNITDRAFLSFLFKQKWFRYVVSRKEFMSDENWKYRAILRSHSAIVYIWFMKYINRKHQN